MKLVLVLVLVMMFCRADICSRIAALGAQLSSDPLPGACRIYVSICGQHGAHFQFARILIYTPEKSKSNQGRGPKLNAKAKINNKVD